MIIKKIKFVSLLLAALLIVFPGTRSSGQDVYFPGAWGTWEAKTPEQVGMNAELLNAAVEFAKSAANKDSKDLEQVIAASFANEPFNTIVGPTLPRGDANGMIIRSGYIVAEWGDTERVIASLE